MQPLSLEELERIKVEKFSQINEIDVKIKCVLKRLEFLTEEYEKLKKRYERRYKQNETMSQDYLEAYSLGKGKYGQDVLRPAKIEQQLRDLKNNVYDKYTGKISKINQREYELKKGILEEDLHQAMARVKQIDQEYKQSCIRLQTAQKAYELCTKKIREFNMALAEYNKVKRKLFAEIKKIDAMITKKLNAKTKKKNF